VSLLFFRDLFLGHLERQLDFSCYGFLRAKDRLEINYVIVFSIVRVVLIYTTAMRLERVCTFLDNCILSIDSNSAFSLASLNMTCLWILGCFQVIKISIVAI